MRVFGFQFYPAAWQAALQTALAAVVAFNVIPQTAADYVTATGVAVLGLITWTLARPWQMGALGTVVSTFLVSLGGFGLHLTDAQLAGVVGLVTMIVPLLMHSRVVPKAGSPSVLDSRLAPLAHTAAAGPVPVP